MKINRFKLNEKVEEKYYIFTELIDDDFSSKLYPVSKLYDNKPDAVNFLLNKLYNTYRDNDFDLDDLEANFNENCNIDDLLSIYEQIIIQELDKPMNLSYRMVALNEPKLDEWIAMRRNLKKFNI
jgi:hypothetical protein